MHKLQIFDLLEPTSTATTTTTTATPKEEKGEPSGKKDDDRELCVICLDANISTVFLECGHMACCGECARCVVSCPMCRRPISRVINVYHANK